jgi:hypothetical protein
MELPPLFVSVLLRKGCKGIEVLGAQAAALLLENPTPPLLWLQHHCSHHCRKVLESWKGEGIR